jgi:hypothetical protein
MQGIFLERRFLFYGWKCLSLKAVVNWAEKFSGGRFESRPYEIATETKTSMLRVSTHW